MSGKSTHVNVRLPKELVEALDALAIETERSRSWLIQDFLTAAVGKADPKALSAVEDAEVVREAISTMFPDCDHPRRLRNREKCLRCGKSVGL